MHKFFSLQYCSLFVLMCEFLQRMFLGAKLLHYRVYSPSVLLAIAKFLSKVIILVYTTYKNMSSSFSMVSPILGISKLLIFASVVGFKSYFIFHFSLLLDGLSIHMLVILVSFSLNSMFIYLCSFSLLISSDWFLLICRSRYEAFVNCVHCKSPNL